MKRVAVIGSGISGLSAAYGLRQHAQVTVFEAEARPGGHANTVDLTLEGVSHGVDTGFLVYNKRTYPQLIALFAELGVETAASDMSFSVQVPDQDLEWNGSDLNTVFAQRRNLLRPAFLRMLREILRFNKLATGIALRNSEAELDEGIGDFLRRERFSLEFRDWYFLPMIGCIWSCPTDQMLRFPRGHDDPLLPQPWAHPGQRPASMANGGGWLAPVRAQAAGRLGTAGHRAIGYTGARHTPHRSRRAGPCGLGNRALR
jgi:predicted NAD/FAD-binding protein